MFKEKIKRIRELTHLIENKYYAYTWSGGTPDGDEDMNSWENERRQIFKEIENKLDELSKEVEEK